VRAHLERRKSLLLLDFLTRLSKGVEREKKGGEKDVHNAWTGLPILSILSQGRSKRRGKRKREKGFHSSLFPGFTEKKGKDHVYHLFSS